VGANVRPEGAALSRFEEARSRAQRAWGAARGRLEHGRKRSDEELLRATTETASADPEGGTATATDSTIGDDLRGASVAPAGELPVPLGVRVAAAWSWRLIIITVAVIGVFYLLLQVGGVMVPVIVALLLTALLQPGSSWLRRHGVPRSLAALIMLIAGIAVVAGVLTGVITSFVNGFSDLRDNVAASIGTIQDWLQKGPLHVSDKQINDALKAGENWLTDNKGQVTTGALSVSTTVGETLVDLFVILFTTFFLVRDGRRIWQFLVNLLLPRNARSAVDDAGVASWRTLVAYVRATVLVAFIDAVCIGVGILAVGVPYSLAVPLAALIFLSAFVPIVGATVSGTVAVLITLVTQGLIAAIIVLVVVLGVQQIEGHLLQPLIMGRAVAIHPLGVILGIATGIAVFGIFGGLIAVPTIAVANTAIRALVLRRRLRDGAPEDLATLARAEPPPSLADAPEAQPDTNHPDDRTVQTPKH
jgi:putative heme transporter